MIYVYCQMVLSKDLVTMYALKCIITLITSLSRDILISVTVNKIYHISPTSVVVIAAQDMKRLILKIGTIGIPTGSGNDFFKHLQYKGNDFLLFEPSAELQLFFLSCMGNFSYTHVNISPAITGFLAQQPCKIERDW